MGYLLHRTEGAGGGVSGRIDFVWHISRRRVRVDIPWRDCMATPAVASVNLDLTSRLVNCGFGGARLGYACRRGGAWQSYQAD